MNERAQTTGAPERETLLTRPVVLLILVSFAALFGFQLLLSVVPLYADEVGGGSSGAGLATAVFMLSTVLTQIQMPRILGRYGYRRALAAGLLFLGVPALFYAYTGTLVTILAVTLLRGVGFGIVTVVFAALVVELAPPGRRGEALGLLGIAITLPTVFCNALGLWLAGRFGFEVVFLLGGVTPLLGLFMIPGIRFAQATGEGRRRAGSVSSQASDGPTCDGSSYSSRPRRWLRGWSSPSCPWRCQVRGFLCGGRAARRRDHLYHKPLVGGTLRRPQRPAPPSRPRSHRMRARDGRPPIGGALLLAGAVLFGTGFGLLQNSTLILMMGRVSKSEFGLGSTLWNAAFDAGTGVGAFSFGFVISAFGFSWSFAICSVLLASALVLVVLDRP